LSGASWADGTSPRIWLTVWAESDPLASWLIRTPWAATLGQATVLFVETTAALGFAFRKTRIPYAVVLLSFHLAMEWWLGLAFYANELTLLALCVTVFITRQPRADGSSMSNPAVG